MRGPLDNMKESWEASTKSDESLVSYVLAVPEKLVKMSELVLGPNDSKNGGMIVMPGSNSLNQVIRCWSYCQRFPTNFSHRGKDRTCIRWICYI